MKPRLFIGSSVEELDVAYAIQEELERDAEVTVWTQGIFNLSASAIESLVATLQAADFGIFALGPVDVAVIRGSRHTVPRDNVIFELGLFVGRLGRDRTFFVVPRDAENLRLPTDLSGLTPVTYDAAREDGNLLAAVGPACSKIRRAIGRVHQPAVAPSGSVAVPPQSTSDLLPNYSGRWRLAGKYTDRWRNHVVTAFDSITLTGDLYLVFPSTGSSGVGSLTGSLNVMYVHEGEPRIAEFLITDRVTDARQHGAGELTFSSERLSRHLIYDSGNLPEIDGFQPTLEAGTHYFSWAFTPTIRPPRCLQGGYESSRSLLNGYLTKYD